MAGAWEILANPRVLVAILHVDNTTMAWSLGLRNLQIPGGLPILPVAGMPFDMARNVCCMRALEVGADYLFFLDSDVVPPSDTIYRLLSHKLPIVSGIYCRRSPPQGIPVMLKNRQWITHYPKNVLLEVDFVGAGCLLISRDVLASLPPLAPDRGRHWFDWRVDMPKNLIPEGEGVSEDFAFCLHAQKHGYKIVVDTSIMCRHVGLAQATYGQFAPCEAASVT